MTDEQLIQDAQQEVREFAMCPMEIGYPPGATQEQLFARMESIVEDIENSLVPSPYAAAEFAAIWRRLFPNAGEQSKWMDRGDVEFSDVLIAASKGQEN